MMGSARRNKKAKMRHVWDLQPPSKTRCNSLQGPASLSTKTALVCITRYFHSPYAHPCAHVLATHLHVPDHPPRVQDIDGYPQQFLQACHGTGKEVLTQHSQRISHACCEANAGTRAASCYTAIHCHALWGTEHSLCWSGEVSVSTAKGISVKIPDEYIAWALSSMGHADPLKLWAPALVMLCTA